MFNFLDYFPRSGAGNVDDYDSYEEFEAATEGTFFGNLWGSVSDWFSSESGDDESGLEESDD